MPRAHMTPALFSHVAARFKAFGEPTRLQILHALRHGERSVGELERDTGLGQANLSRQLQQLLVLGLVARRKDGLFAFYTLADRDVLKLCDLMCGRLEKELGARKQAQRAR